MVEPAFAKENGHKCFFNPLKIWFGEHDFSWDASITDYKYSHYKCTRCDERKKVERELEIPDWRNYDDELDQDVCPCCLE